MSAALLSQKMPLSDVQLSRSIANGDTKAFEQLMRRHNRSLFRTARAILRDDAEAEDAVQEAYLRAYRSFGSFRGEAKLSTWLVRIAANEALARRRKEARRTNIVPIRGADLEAADAVPEAHAPHADQPEHQAARGELRRLFEAKIDTLPEAFRTVFVLRALEELSVDETAAALDIPPATVRTRFFRARSLLREALSQEIDLAFDDAFAFAGERCDRIVSRVLARLAGTPSPLIP
ncbi:MAG TPA: RNA polymerase sigma factor [Burkholderiales bacterium]|nr:RNA polymerase sigma factor [Burkholderiales bacterium]